MAGATAPTKEPVVWLAVIALTWVLTTVVVLPVLGRCLGSADLTLAARSPGVADEDVARRLHLV
jgi:hypothetical protein